VKPAPPDPAALAIGPAFLASFSLLRQRPVVLPALGAAIVLSLVSVCCGIGLLTTPWFLCELFATQLTQFTGKPAFHSVSWLPAGSILLGAVLLVVGVASLTLVGAGAELPAEVTPVSGVTTLMRSSGFYACISGTAALLLIVPVLYAPLALIERRAGFADALLESVRIVMRRGVWANLWLSLVAHLVQSSPLLLAAIWAAYGTRSLVPQALLIAAPLLAVSVPLGQGMIVWSYVGLRSDASPPAPSTPPPPRTAAALRMISRWTFIWSLVVALPIVALLLLGLSLIRPSTLGLGAAPDGELVADLVPKGREVRQATLESTSLEISTNGTWAKVVAADGGGTGELRLRDVGAVTRVRVVRVRDTFAIEVRQGATSSLTFIDRAGVRLDDDLRARLSDRVSGRGALFVLLFPFVATLWTVPVLHRLGRVQLAFRKYPDRRPGEAVLDSALRRSVQRTRLFVALLLPLDLFALGLGVHALGFW